MDLRQLEALRAIAEHGSFSNAAEALHTVQSNVSTRISRLERELHVELVDRASRKLTPAGEAVLERARRVEAEIAAIPSDIAAQNDEVRGLVKGAFIPSTARWLTPILVEELRDRLPLVRLHITEAPTSAITPGVQQGSFDFGVISLPIDTSSLDAEILYNETTELIVPLDHPLAGAKALSLVDLESLSLIVPPPETPLRDDLDRAYFDRRLDLSILIEVNGVRLIEDLVRTGFGPAILPSTLVAVDEGYARVQILDAPIRRVALVRNPQRALTVPANAVVAIIDNIVAENADSMRGVGGKTDRSPNPNPSGADMHFLPSTPER